MAELAAAVTRSDVPRAVNGELVAEPQDNAAMTLAPPLRREDGRVDFRNSAVSIKNLVRGLSPRPGAHTTIRNKALRLGSVDASDETLPGQPGEVHVRDGRPWVTTGSGSVQILRATLEGKREASGTDLVNGRTLRAGDVLGQA
jgi:methionyl-tRNA formyltransferase